MKGWIIAVAIAATLAGCDGRERLVQTAVKGVLNDPDSAKFGSIDVHGHDAGLVACGTVNAKNRMGGYVGEMPFMVWSDKVYFDEGDYKVALCCSMLMNEQAAGASILSQEASRACATAEVGVGSLSMTLLNRY